MNRFLYLYGSEIFVSDAIVDLRELDTRYCTDMRLAFYGYQETRGRHPRILGIESFDTSNVQNFSEVFDCTDTGYTSQLNLDLSKWDVRNGKDFSDFARFFNTLDISSFGENEELNNGNLDLGCRYINNLIIDGKYVSISNGSTYYTGITNLYATHNLLNSYKNKLGNFVENYKPCEKLIKATIPEGYAISFNDSIVPEQDGIAYIPYKTTKATYCMINPNYLPVTGEIDVSAMARSEEKDITLEDTAKDTSGYTQQ